MVNFTEVVGKPAMLEQCAEECTELAQACLKMARKMRNENPTPAAMNDILANLNEEVADVMICMTAIVEGGLLSYESIDSEYTRKEERLRKRLETINK